MGWGRPLLLLGRLGLLGLGLGRLLLLLGCLGLLGLGLGRLLLPVLAVQSLVAPLPSPCHLHRT